MRSADTVSAHAGPCKVLRCALSVMPAQVTLAVLTMAGEPSWSAKRLTATSVRMPQPNAEEPNDEQRSDQISRKPAAMVAGRNATPEREQV